ncbi:Hydroxyproline dehydrogenase [Nymphon striatum]|nr:Hydroxyproline dehydrogenase [Nymphon striatum]
MNTVRRTLASTKTRSIFRQWENFLQISNQNSNLLRFSVTSTCNNVRFDDHIAVYKNRSTAELLRNIAVLKVCSFDVFVDNSLQLMNIGQKSLGRHFFRFIMKYTFYSQFVAGENSEEILTSAEKLISSNIYSLPTAMLEENELFTDGNSTKRFEANLDVIKDCVEIGDRITSSEKFKMCHFKFTGLMPYTLMVKLTEIYENSNNKQEMVRKISESMLSGKKIYFEELSKSQNDELNDAVVRLGITGQISAAKKVKILIDAEYVNTNPAISLLCVAMMVAFNKQKVLIHNTYQCYLKTTTKTVIEDKTIAENLGSGFGAKVVRGAYIHIEKERAQKQGYEDPICESLEKTSEQYDGVIKMLLERVKEKPEQTGLVIATHNETSVLRAMDQLNKLDISTKKGNAVFAQILGIGDHITYSLADKGYIVYKSIPYGPMEELLPYLSRRAMENKAIMRGAIKERNMVMQELKRRLYFKS